MQIAVNDLAGRITGGETKNLELKSNLRWNPLKDGFDTQIENATLKTIVAFCNTEGGELLIGVADDGTILGIDRTTSRILISSFCICAILSWTGYYPKR